MSEKQLIKKLTEVMQQVEYIQKTGFNKFHKYNYATEADVNEKVRKELSERSIMMIPNVKSCVYREHTTRGGSVEYITTVEVEFTFMDGETGETIVFSSFGEGQDAGDKGVYKAITGAQKYALMKAFMIPTGDDPEGDSGTDERNQNKESKTPQQVGQERLRQEQDKYNERHADEDLTAIDLDSKQNVDNVNAEPITDGQGRMFWVRAKQAGFGTDEQKAEMWELLSAHLARMVSDPKHLYRREFNGILKWFEEKMNEAVGV